MRLESKKYLFDIQEAARHVAEFTSGKSFEDYESDAMLRRAVEREFEIIGEALSQLAKADPGVASRITEHRKIIDFRNVLIHAYADIDNALVWGTLQLRLPQLLAEVGSLMAAD